jgi:hypothetical protein
MGNRNAVGTVQKVRTGINFYKRTAMFAGRRSFMFYNMKNNR